MSKSELEFKLTKLGLDAEGSRFVLAARLWTHFEQQSLAEPVTKQSPLPLPPPLENPFSDFDPSPLENGSEKTPPPEIVDDKGSTSVPAAVTQPAEPLPVDASPQGPVSKAPSDDAKSATDHAPVDSHAPNSCVHDVVPAALGAVLVDPKEVTPEKRPDAENTLVWTPLEKPVRDSKFKKGNPGKVYIPVLECALCGQPKRFESKKPVASHGAMCGFCWNRLVFHGRKHLKLSGAGRLADYSDLQKKEMAKESLSLRGTFFENDAKRASAEESENPAKQKQKRQRQK